MLLVFESGRLGNQLFQYVAMRAASPDGVIVTVGMSDLRRLFKCPNTVGFSFPFKAGRMTRACLSWGIARLKQALVFLSWIRVIGVISEHLEADSSAICVRQGALRGVFFVEEGYWQCARIVEQAKDFIPRIQPQFESQALDSIASLGVRQENLYFLHVRRGDYLSWPSKECPAAIPLAWYEKQIERIKDLNPAAFFLVFSDDLPYVQRFFNDKEGISVISGDVFSDFSLMTQCRGGGVLSASSYAWWAACISRQRDGDAYFVAPLYWAGHRRGKWFPECVQTDWLDYQPVLVGVDSVEG